MQKDILIVIPDIGDKKDITRKNLRVLNDRPLIAYAVATARCVGERAHIVVVTRDLEMQNVCGRIGVEWIPGSYDLASDNVVLDPIVYEALTECESRQNIRYKTVITLQATSPLLKGETLLRAIQEFEEHSYDTLISAINRPNLSWKFEDGKYVPTYRKRENRKYLPRLLVETGSFLISDRNKMTKDSRIGEVPYIFEVTAAEGLEIRDSYDWLIAEKELQKKKILIRLEAYEQIGMGHLYRGMQLASILNEHEVSFAISSKSSIAADKLREVGYRYQLTDTTEDLLDYLQTERFDIVVNDILNTDRDYMRALKKTGLRIINFEDMGTGAAFADAVINALYEGQEGEEHIYAGRNYFCLRDEFLIAHPKDFSHTVEEVLIVFGGTDPSNLARKALEAIAVVRRHIPQIHYTFIIGGGNRNRQEIEKMAEAEGSKITVLYDVEVMSEYMGKADLALSSMGRTMYELAYMRVPTVVMAQNPRELMHEFGYLENGFINLGIGKDINADTLSETMIWLIKSPQIRKQIYDQMEKLDLEHGIHRVKKIILGE